MTVQISQVISLPVRVLLGGGKASSQQGVGVVVGAPLVAVVVVWAATLEIVTRNINEKNTVRSMLITAATALFVCYQLICILLSTFIG